jgi:uncharacterized protein
MKKLIAITALIYASVILTSAQTQPERRVIEVTGSAERLVTPDEFTFRITLAERFDSKQKITIEQQEAGLRLELAKLGIDVAKDLSIYDLSSTYFRQKKLKDVLGTKDYSLKIRDLNQIAPLQDMADRILVGQLDLVSSEHSQMTRLRRETKIDAVKAAKAKAEYLLEAIGQRVGIAVYIKEDSDEMSRYAAGSNSNTIRGSDGAASPGNGLTLAPIRVRYEITAKFEIE